MSAYGYRTDTGTDVKANIKRADVSPSSKDVSSKRLPTGSGSKHDTFGQQVAYKSAQGCFVVENLKISGDTLMSKVNDLIGQGNVHRIVIKNKEGHTLLSVPTTLQAMGNSIDTILSSEAAAINIISAIVPYPKLVVEKFTEQYI